MVLSQLYYLLIYFLFIFISSIFIDFDKTIYHFFVPIVLSVFIEKYFYDFKFQLYVISLVYFIITSVIYFNLFKVNEWGFFPNFDDSFYFSQGQYFLKTGYEFDTFFDIIVWFFQKLGMNNNYSLSTINLFLSILVLGLVGNFSKLINSGFKSNYIYFLGFNVFFMECAVALYRDMFGLFFILISFILIKSRRNFYLPLFISFFIRTINPVIILIYYFFNKIRFFNSFYKGKIFILLLIALVSIYILDYLPMDFLGRDGVYSGMTLGDINQRRSEFFFGEGQSDLTSKLISYGVFASPLVLFLNIFTPLKFSEIFVYKEFTYLVDGVIVYKFIDSILNYSFIFQVFHISMIAFLIISFLSGLYCLIVREKKHVEILIFLICLIFVSFVSFQPRHKLYFLIFVPLICSYNNIKPKFFLYYGATLEIIYLSIFLVIGILGV